MQDRPVIGIITAKVADEAQHQLLSGILHKTQEKNCKAVVISNIYNFHEYFAGTEVENKIYDMITSPKLDGLILTAETIWNEDLQQRIYHRILDSRLPVVVVGAEIEGLECLNNDVSADFEQIAHHLTKVHHFTEYDFLTGYEGNATSEERVAGFRKELARHGLELPQENVIYGDFWYNSGEALAREYVSGKRRIPQAVVCANDYMAYGICDVLLEHNVSVPDEIAVIGYEYVGERFYHSPILTTYLRNREAIGAMAVEHLLAKITGEPAENVVPAGKMILGDTCPCGVNKTQLSYELGRTRRTQYYTNLNYEGNFEQQLTMCRSITDYTHTLQEFSYLVRDCVGVYLCLYENWASLEDPVTIDAPSDHAPMLCYRVISQNHNASDTPQYFQRDQIFPDFLPGSTSDDFFYLAPIFFSGRELGHFILQYDKPDTYDAIFGSWLKIACNGLEALRLKNDIHALLECQNLSENHDTATGLWNRHGFYKEMDHAIGAALPEENLLLLLIHTSVFTDDSSIDGQSISVRMDAQIAESFKRIAHGQREFAAKLGDHLFCLGAVGDYTTERASLLSDQLRSLIEHSPLYLEHCGPDNYVSSVAVLPAKGSDVFAENSHLLEQINEQIRALSAVRTHTSYREYSFLRHSIFREPEKPWNAQETCRDFHLSYGHFRATYKELFGVSFHQDLISCRIALAKYLLLTTSQSLQNIAYQCGYDDDKYFLRQFRQTTGFTPNSYRTK